MLKIDVRLGEMGQCLNFDHDICVKLLCLYGLPSFVVDLRLTVLETWEGPNPILDFQKQR